jgi:putative membrane protein
MIKTIEPSRISNNKFVLTILSMLFAVCWIYFFVTTRSPINWWIENILVILFIPCFYFIQKKFTFSNASLICIFLFLLVHMYGAQMSYTYNQLGIWLQQRFHLWRNPYDRIVHFSFGLLIVYPIQDYLVYKLNTPIKWSYKLSVLIILGLATIFELIEWMVAMCTDSETGETYVATQGDVWDAHKDIALALLASILVMYVLSLHKRRNEDTNTHTPCQV